MTTYGNLAGHSVARIGFGAMQLPGPGVFGPPRDRDTALAVLRRAVELGVDHIDTAQYYGPDVSNELIHTALHPYDEGLVLVSKVGGDRDDQGNWIPAQRPEQLRAGVEANLASLEVEQVDVVNLRLMDEHEGAMPADQKVSFDDQLAEMVALRDEGKIGAIGLSNVTTDQVRHALESTSIACVQNAFNLLHRDGQSTLSLCAERGLAYVPFFPLGSAFSFMPKVTDDEVVQAVAAELGVTAVQVGLAWLLAHDPSILLIPGTSSLDHLEENLDSAEVSLTPEHMARLETARRSQAA
jgi:aryl-alcohol dehydrogenase-like predicted oxidoreductase